VQAAGEFLGQCGVDGARPCDAVLALERGTDHRHGVMSLPARLGPGMAGVLRTVVGHRQMRRRKRGGQGCLDPSRAG
jgi:hypothetical protein